jgi:hypothetical protein
MQMLVDEDGLPKQSDENKKMLLTKLDGKSTKQQQNLIVSWLQMGYVHREKPFAGQYQSYMDLDKVSKR